MQHASPPSWLTIFLTLDEELKKSKANKKNQKYNEALTELGPWNGNMLHQKLIVFQCFIMYERRTARSIIIILFGFNDAICYSKEVKKSPRRARFFHFDSPFGCGSSSLRPMHPAVTRIHRS